MKDDLQHHYVYVGRCEEVSTEYGGIILRLHETRKVKNLHIYTQLYKSFDGKEWGLKQSICTQILLQLNLQNSNKTCIVSFSMAMLRKSLIFEDLKASIWSSVLPSRAVMLLYFSWNSLMIRNIKPQYSEVTQKLLRLEYP